DKANVMRLAIGQHILTSAIDQVIAVLYRRHLEYLRCGPNVRDRHFTQACMPNDAAIDQRLDCAELLVARHLWINSMQLPQANLLDAQSMAAGIGLLNQIFRPSERRPAIRPRPDEAC